VRLLSGFGLPEGDVWKQIALAREYSPEILKKSARQILVVAKAESHENAGRKVGVSAGYEVLLSISCGDRVAANPNIGRRKSQGERGLARGQIINSMMVKIRALARALAALHLDNQVSSEPEDRGKGSFITRGSAERI